MAAETEIIPRLQEIRFMIGGMGIMAPNAVTFSSNLMTAFCLLRDNGFMTLKAGFVRIVTEQFAMGRGMGVVALRTFAILYRGMDKRALQLFAELVMAIEAELPRRPGFQLKLVLGVGQGKNGHGNEEQKQEKNLRSNLHAIPSQTSAIRCQLSVFSLSSLSFCIFIYSFELCLFAPDALRLTPFVFFPLWGDMAVLTRPPYERRVDDILEKLRIF